MLPVYRWSMAIVLLLVPLTAARADGPVGIGAIGDSYTDEY